MAPSDRESQPSLLQRVARGDAAAVNAVLDRYGALVWSVVSKQMVPSAAEDVVQEVFVDVWKSAPRYDPSLASEATFIVTIARRRLIDRQRKDSRRPETELLEEELSSSWEQLETVDVGDEARHALEAMQALRPDQQRVLKLSILSGLSHSQIAATTGLPLGTVKSHARRGLERVREILEVPPRESSKKVSS